MNANTPHSNSDESRRLAIGVLSVTATVLLVGILVVSLLNRPVLAIGQTDRGGDYIMVTMQFRNDTENLVVTDAAAERMIVYGWNQNTRKLDIWSVFDLKRLKDGVPRQAGGDQPRRNERDRRNGGRG